MTQKISKKQRKKDERQEIINRCTVSADPELTSDMMMFYEDKLNLRWFYNDWVAAGRPREDYGPSKKSQNKYTEKEQKLLARPVEIGTLVTKTIFVRFEEFQALFECWSWEGISAKSIIVLKVDVPNTNNEILLDSLFNQLQMPRDPKLTMIETSNYLFINFDFETYK